MPVFHFHIVTSATLIRDEEGAIFPDLDAARLEAVRGARALLNAELLNGELDLRPQIEVHDDAGRHLSTVRFGDVVRITSPVADDVVETASP